MSRRDPGPLLSRLDDVPRASLVGVCCGCLLIVYTVSCLFWLRTIPTLRRLRWTPKAHKVGFRVPARSSRYAAHPPPAATFAVKVDVPRTVTQARGRAEKLLKANGAQFCPPPIAAPSWARSSNCAVPFQHWHVIAYALLSARIGSIELHVAFAGAGARA